MVFLFWCSLFCDLAEEDVVSWGLNISYSLDQFGILNESKKLQEKSLRMMHDSWNCCAMRASSVEQSLVHAGYIF